MREENERQHDAACSALARKRRIVLRSKQRRYAELDNDDDDDDDDSHMEKRVCVRDDDESVMSGLDDSVLDGVSSMRRRKPSIQGIKRLTRYDPGVPMTRDELTAWRKEARRVRNRESAAESRRRTRGRIDELESQLDALQTKYAAALQRIVELERSPSNDTVELPTMAQDVMASIVVSPCPSAASSPPLLPSISPSPSPRSSFTLGSAQEDKHKQEVERKYQHIIEMISRPNA